MPNVLIGTGTKFTEEIGQIPNPYPFFPNTSPPQMLAVKAYNGDEWVSVRSIPTVAISGESFEIVNANLASFGIANKGAVNGSYDGLPIKPNSVFNEPVRYKTGNSQVVPKDAHWVDGTGTTLEISEGR